MGLGEDLTAESHEPRLNPRLLPGVLTPRPKFAPRDWFVALVDWRAGLMLASVSSSHCGEGGHVGDAGSVRDMGGSLCPRLRPPVPSTAQLTAECARGGGESVERAPAPEGFVLPPGDDGRCAKSLAW